LILNNSVEKAHKFGIELFLVLRERGYLEAEGWKIGGGG
jgi:hypothetical protein